MDINVFAKFYEIPSLPFQDIEKHENTLILFELLKLVSFLWHSIHSKTEIPYLSMMTVI